MLLLWTKESNNRAGDDLFFNAICIFVSIIYFGKFLYRCRALHGHCPNSVYFHSIPFFRRGSSLQVENLSVCLFVCLSVCHHFKISNIGPLYHPRITPDPTYHILLGRGWCQLSSGDVNDTHKDKYKDKYTDKDNYKVLQRPNVCYIFEEQGCVWRWYGDISIWLFLVFQ